MRWPSKSCVFLGMCLMVSGASMRAQTGKVVKAVAQTSNYPVVELVVNVRDGATGQGVYGLNKSTFAVIENNELQEINNFVVKARGKVEPIDIVFIFDQTGSMQDEINAVKNNVLMFADILRGSSMDFRLGLITFSDVVERTRDFTSDVSNSRPGSRTSGPRGAAMSPRTTSKL